MNVPNLQVLNELIDSRLAIARREIDAKLARLEGENEAMRVRLENTPSYKQILISGFAIVGVVALALIRAMLFK